MPAIWDTLMYTTELKDKWVQLKLKDPIQNLYQEGVKIGCSITPKLVSVKSYEYLPYYFSKTLFSRTKNGRAIEPFFYFFLIIVGKVLICFKQNQFWGQWPSSLISTLDGILHEAHPSGQL